MATKTLTFWFEFASTYSYPSASRIKSLADAAGIAVDWKPFLLGPLFANQGWNDSPFNIYPAKGHYMWRDLARICQREGLPLTHPSVFPRNGLLAARVVVAANGEDWLNDFVQAVYHANFAEDREISDAEILQDILAGLDQDPAVWLAKAQSSEAKSGLRSNTEQAVALGIFGSPSFMVDGELFWGNDRLEQALEWAVSEG